MAKRKQKVYSYDPYFGGWGSTRFRPDVVDVEFRAKQGFDDGCSKTIPRTEDDLAYLAGFLLARRWVGQLERSE